MRDALARVAGGRDGQCVDPKTSPAYGLSHMNVNIVITPTATGAVGRSYLIAMGIGKDLTKFERQGGYEDEYVKTPTGWKFKTRTHVWPDMKEIGAVQVDEQGPQLTDQRRGEEELQPAPRDDFFQ